MSPKKSPPRVGLTKGQSRKVAWQALRRISEDGAYANLVLPKMLDAIDPPLPERDRRFVTDLVYGTTRMQRACDWYVDRFVSTEPDADARALLRLGAYQLAFTDIPAYAAVSATVAVTPVKIRGFVNAVLRQTLRAPADWPSDGVRLSYPDWIIERLSTDLGADVALAALASMNEPATSHARPDGYVQDPASQWVAGSVGATSGERVLDVCAAPGGKASAMAGGGAFVVAADNRLARVGLIAGNRDRLELRARVAVVAADGNAQPFRAASFDRILVDAPCSGLGSLRRRPDARWRIDSDGPERLASLQQDLLAAAIALLRPGGTLAYSVCTLTDVETIGIDDWLAAAHPELVAVGPLDAPWQAHGRGSLLLPQTVGTDGMFVLRLRSATAADGGL